MVQGPPNQRRHILATGCLKKVQWKTSLDHFPERGTRPSKPAPSHFGDRLCQKKFNGKQAWTTFRKVVQGPPNQRRHILVTGCVKKVQWKTSSDHFPESGTRPSKPAPSHFGDRLCQKSSMENKLGPFPKVVQGPPNQRRHILATGCLKKVQWKTSSDHFPESGTRPSKPAPSHFGDRLCQKSSMENKLGPLSGKWYKALQTSAVTFGNRMCETVQWKTSLDHFPESGTRPLNQRRHILGNRMSQKVQWKTSLDHFPESGTRPSQTSARHILVTGCVKKVQWKTSLDHFPESGTRPSKPAPSHFGDRLCQKSSMENKLGPLSRKWYKALQTSAVTFWQQDVSKKFNGKQAWTTFRKVVQGALQTSAVTFW